MQTCLNFSLTGFGGGCIILLSSNIKPVRGCLYHLPLQMRKLRLREGKSPSQSCTAPANQRWTVNLGSCNCRDQGFSCIPCEPSVPHWLPLGSVHGSLPSLSQNTPPHTWHPGSSSRHPPPSSFQRRGPTGRPVRVRKFQPHEPTQAWDSEQPVALGETETWLAGGGVVTGNLKSCHFLGFPEGTGRSQRRRDALNRV